MQRSLFQISMSLDGFTAQTWAFSTSGPGGERLHATKRRNRCVDYDPGR
jgi:hypothetical protein